MRTEWWPGRCSDEKKDGTCLVTVTGGQTLEGIQHAAPCMAWSSHKLSMV